MIPKSKIKEIIDLIEGTDISEIEITSDKDTNKIRISRLNHGANPLPFSEGLRVPQTAAPAPQPAQVAEGSAEKSDSTPELLVKAPLVGTYYASPKPDAPPFVKVGDIIDVGQTVCLIEAMKIFNEIESEVAGKVVRIMLENEAPVEYGQTLLVVEPV
ncbi:MAG: acetyl-CoA carboxylase biotin carboxyl carrier protein [FCB group bacterium]|nr:acetyl-CoA carboxylase biotin carboxyl carrier protein [FCB group bacterium]